MDQRLYEEKGFGRFVNEVLVKIGEFSPKQRGLFIEHFKYDYCLTCGCRHKLRPCKCKTNKTE